jgi:hypothetical protein
MIGYGIRIDGDIDLKTVSNTQQAAMVNYLLVHPRIMVLQSDTYEQIKSAFIKYKHPKHELVKVEIKFLKVINHEEANNRA